MTGKVLIKGGTVIDAGGSRRGDVVVEDGIVTEVAEGAVAPAGATVLDADGAVVCPGFVDLHTHLREPGGEDAETIETGARAGALGGYTALVAMPNTNPPIDTAAVVEQVLRLGRVAPCHVVSSACITKGRAGEELAPLGELHGLGVRIFTDDGTCVADAGLMRRALEYARALPGAVLAQHCEDPQLARGGQMNEGAWSSWLGIPGMPAEAESVVVARDIALAGLTGGRVHFLHLSTATSIELVRAAKSRGLAVTAEAAPHHFTLTDSLCCGYDPLFKVNPPLRTEADVKAVKEGLADGTIDAIATDHAPHPAQEKERPFDEAPPGMLGLETALALTLTELVGPGLLDLPRALALLSWQPAHLAGLADHGGPVAPGRPAHLCVFDPEAVWEVDPTKLASRSRNTPYAGRKLTGRVRHTLLAGEPVVIDSQAQR
ncbi:MAG TPA: dihydroorotase [Acidimicrobiia bacterium]|nr:dihydroorotase [Acidimicrobiia bacterium]